MMQFGYGISDKGRAKIGQDLQFWVHSGVEIVVRQAVKCQTINVNFGIFGLGRYHSDGEERFTQRLVENRKEDGSGGFPEDGKTLPIGGLTEDGEKNAASRFPKNGETASVG